MGQAASYAGDDEQQAAADCFEHEEGEYSKPGDLASATLRMDRIELLLTQASSHRCFLEKLSKEEKKQYTMLRCCCGWESKYKERTCEATMRVMQDHRNHSREVKERQFDWNAAKRLLKLLKEATTLIGDRGHADVGVAKREFLARAMAREARHLWKGRTGSADAGSPLLIAVAKGCLHFMMAYATLSSKERAAMERIVMLSHRTGRVPPLTAAHSAVMRDVAEPLPATQAAQDVSLAALQESGCCEALQVCEGYAAEAYEGVSEGSSDSDEDETDVADDELSSLEELGKRSDPDVRRKYAADAPLRAAVDSLASFGNYEHAKLPNRGAKKRRLEEAASAPGQERLVTSAPPISDRAPPQKRNARRVNDPPLKKARPAAPLPQPARATVDAAHAMHSPSPAEAIGCVESTE